MVNQLADQHFEHCPIHSPLPTVLQSTARPSMLGLRTTAPLSTEPFMNHSFSKRSTLGASRSWTLRGEEEQVVNLESLISHTLAKAPAGEDLGKPLEDRRQIFSRQAQSGLQVLQRLEHLIRIRDLVGLCLIGGACNARLDPAG